jgi:hypothetical protein
MAKEYLIILEWNIKPCDPFFSWTKPCHPQWITTACVKALVLIHWLDLLAFEMIYGWDLGLFGSCTFSMDNKSVFDCHHVPQFYQTFLTLGARILHTPIILWDYCHTSMEHWRMDPIIWNYGTVVITNQGAVWSRQTWLTLGVQGLSATQTGHLYVGHVNFCHCFWIIILFKEWVYTIFVKNCPVKC